MKSNYLMNWIDNFCAEQTAREVFAEDITAQEGAIALLMKYSDYAEQAVAIVKYFYRLTCAPLRIVSRSGRVELYYSGERVAVRSFVK